MLGARVSGLKAICEHAQSLTGATSAVIQLREGDEMVYAAAVGSAADHLGLRLSIWAGLSGLCVPANTAQISPDTGADPRVDARRSG